MRSWIFSIITPVFSVTWSSEIIIIFWYAAQETFLININVEISCAAKFKEKKSYTWIIQDCLDLFSSVLIMFSSNIVTK